MSAHRCDECGAEYATQEDSCAARFAELLALDHSRREPWGSRHGQAFAAFVLQHPRYAPNSLDAAWTALYRIYCNGEAPMVVFASLRAASGTSDARTNVPQRPATRATRPGVTIADLGDFAAESYSVRLDEWCRATLGAWGAATHPSK